METKGTKPVKRILAFDFGASSGRAMIGTLENNQLNIVEIHRFANEPVTINGRLYWDVLRLFHEIKQGIVIANQKGGFDSIGIDTWGVDYGLLDENDEILSNPSHYRDSRTEGIPEEIFEKFISKDELYKKTGIQSLNINTIFQLYYDAKYRPNRFALAKTFLMIPDLFAFLLTGCKRLEYTIASTTGLLNPVTKTIDNELLDRLGIDKSIFPKIIMPGEAYGNLSKEICDELHCDSVPVFAVATHDTASAVVSVPSDTDDCAYVSCGTWSLLGTLLENPVLTTDSDSVGFTNEGAADGKIRYLRNIMGLWLIQQSRQEYKRRGLDVSFDEMEKQAKNAQPFAAFINPDDVLFSPPGDMPSRVSEFCKRTGQTVPDSMGSVLRCIYESLAFKYRRSIEGMEKITGKKFTKLYMVGGGIKDQLLCQMAANACSIPVIAGPVEATVTGNILIQNMAFGHIKDLMEIRSIVKQGTPIKEYLPQDSDIWNEQYDRFLKFN
ncbi:MAG: rhamnulokinase family protein [bacterium]|nr:rhamnulokinase family protein [bacterium]